MVIILVSVFTLPFLAKKPIDVIPLISVELIQVSDTTNIPYAPKAAKIIDKVKKNNEKLLSEQAPPKKVEKEKIKETKLDPKKDNIKQDTVKKVNLDEQIDDVKKTKSKKTPTPENKKEIVKNENADGIPMPDKKKVINTTKEEKEQQPSKEKKKNLVKEDKKLKPEKKLKDDKVIKNFAETKKPTKKDDKVMQTSEFETKELFDVNEIKGLIDQQTQNVGQVKKRKEDIFQSDDPTMIDRHKLTLSQTDSIKRQYYACWAVPAGLPLNDKFLLTVKLILKKNGEYEDIDVVEKEKMGTDKRFKAFADSVLRAIHLCNPLKTLPAATYKKWKFMVLKFSPLEMQGG